MKILHLALMQTINNQYDEYLKEKERGEKEKELAKVMLKYFDEKCVEEDLEISLLVARKTNCFNYIDVLFSRHPFDYESEREREEFVHRYCYLKK